VRAHDTPTGSSLGTTPSARRRRDRAGEDAGERGEGISTSRMSGIVQVNKMMTETTRDQGIREARRKAGITIERLALMSEIDKGYLSQIERGKKTPRSTTLRRIWLALDSAAGETKSRRKPDAGEEPREAVAWCLRLADALLSEKTLSEHERLWKRVEGAMRTVLEQRRRGDLPPTKLDQS
jgi:transcriptional regulator with XRE-family HTH domain